MKFVVVGQKKEQEEIPVAMSMELDEDGDVNIYANGTELIGWFESDGRLYLAQGDDTRATLKRLGFKTSMMGSIEVQ